MSFRHMVIHGPEKSEDMEKLVHEISSFRAEKTMRYLEGINISPAEIIRLLRESSPL